MKIKARHLVYAGSMILAFIAEKMAEKEAQRDLEVRVNNAILAACIKIGMLEVDND